MASIGEAFIKIKADTAQFGKELEQGLGKAINSQSAAIGSSMKQIGKGMTDVGKQLSVAVTAPVIGLGVAVLKASGDFEQGMNKVRALTGATGTDFDKLRNQAKELGESTKFSATQAADAMGFLGMAGFDVNQIYDAMPSVLQLAAAANIDLGRAADITSNIMSGFGLTSEELASANDTLVATLSSTNTNLDQLGDAFKYVGPVAKGAGLSFNETAAAIGLLGNAGIQGSMAGTSLRGAITKLLNPTKDASVIMERLGITALDSAGNLLPLDQIIQQLEVSGISTAEMMTVFGQRAGPAMLALVEQGSGALQDLTKQLDESGGTAERIANVQMEGFKGAITELKSAIEGLLISIGDAGLLGFAERLARKLTEFVRTLSQVNPEVLKFATIVAGIAAAVGPSLIALGTMVKLTGSLVLSLPSLVGAFGFLSSKLAFLAGPIGVAVGAFALLLAVSPEFRSAMSDVVRALGPVIKALAGSLTPILKVVGELMGGLAKAIAPLLASSLNDVARIVRVAGQAFEAAARFIDDFAKKARDGAAVLTQWIDNVGNLLGGIDDLSSRFSFLGDAFDIVKNAVEGAINPFAGLAGVFERLGWGASDASDDVKDFSSQTLTASNIIDNEIRIALAGMGADLDNVGASAFEAAEESRMLSAAFRVLSDAGVDLAVLGLGAMVDGFDDFGLSLEEVQERLGDFVSGLSESLDSAKAAFFSFKQESLTSLDEFMTGMFEQIAAFNEWEMLLVAAAGRVPPQVLNELAALGPGGVQILRDLNTASDAELADLLALFSARFDAMSSDSLAKLAAANPELAAIIEAFGITIGVGLDGVKETAGFKASELGTTIPDRIQEQINANSGQVTESVNTMLSNATAGPNTDLARFRAEEIGKAIPGGVKAGIEATAGEVENVSVSALTRAFNGATRYLQVRSPSGLFRDRVGKPIMMGVAEGVKQSAPNAEREITAVLTRIIGTSQQTALQAFTAGQAAFRSAWQGGWSQVVSVAESAGRSIQSSFSSSANAMQNTTNSFFASVRRGWQTYQQDASNALRSIEEAFRQGSSTLQTTFLQMINAITQAWQRLGQQLVSTLQSAISDARNRASSGGREIGTALIDGTIQGIQNRSGGLANALVNAVRRAVDAAKAAARVSSPSKVTEEELGKPLIEGIIKAIDDEGNLVKVALLSAVLDPMNDMRMQSENLIRITSRTGRQFIVQYRMAEKAVASTNQAIADGVQAVDQFTTSASNSLQQWVVRMGQSAREWATDFESVVDRVVQHGETRFTRLADTMGRVLSQVVRNIESDFQRMISTIEAGLDRIANRPVSMPSISQPGTVSKPPARLPTAPPVDTFFPGRGPGESQIVDNAIWSPGWGAAEGPGIWKVAQPATSAQRGPAVQIMSATFVTPMDADAIAQKVLVAERARSLSS